MRAIVLLLAAALCCGSAGAQVPREINYQGYLTAAGGTPLNTTVNMVFSLYNDPTLSVSPHLLYTETQLNVPVVNGVFNVRIGSVTPIPGTVLFDQPYYLGVTVGADAEMTPRQLVTPAPVALSLPGLYTQENATSPNLVGGASSNSVGPAVVGGVIGGGGSSDGPNEVRAAYGTIPGGKGALADHYGQQAYASGHFQYPGDAQASLFVLRGVSVEGAVVTLTLDGNVGSSLKMPNKRSLMASILVVARNTAVSNAGYAGNILFDRSGSSIYVNGSTASPTELPPVFEDVSAWRCWAKGDNPQFAALIQCSGSAGSTVRFVATVRTAEVQWENAATPQSSAAGEPADTDDEPKQ